MITESLKKIESAVRNPYGNGEIKKLPQEWPPKFYLAEGVKFR